MKRFLSFVLTLCLLAGMGITAFADTTTQTPITRVDITIPEFAVGDTITTDGVSISAGNVTYINWCKMPDWGTAAEGTFEQNQIYCLDIIVNAPDGQYFADPEYVFNGGEASGSVYGDETSINIIYYVDFSLPQVQSVELSGLPESIAPGALQTPELTVTHGEVEITAVQWVSEEKNPVTTIEDGKGYYLEVSFAPKQGYCLGDFMDVHGDRSYAMAEASADRTTAKAYFYYSLKPEIEKIELTVSGVAVGKNIEDVKVTLPTDAKYTLEELYIYNANMEPLQTGAFQDKQVYQLEFYLQPAAGYDFAENLEVLVDGETTYEWGGQITYTFVYKNYSFRTKLDKVEMTVTEPVVGGNVADAVVKVPADAKYEVQYYWTDAATGDPVTDGKFQDKHKYELSFDLFAAEGYEFALDASITINGAEVERSWIEERDPSYGWGWKSWSFMTAIDKIDFPAFLTVNAGDSKDINVQLPAGAKYTLEVLWQPMEDDGDADTLQNNNVYFLLYYAQANEGYEITDDTVILVDGKEYIGLSDKADFNALVGKVYSFGYPTVEKMELTVTAPENGAKPGEVTAPEDAKFTIDSIEWYTNTTGDVFGETDEFETFQYGNYYFFVASVTAAEGYVLDDNIAIYMNGEKVETAAYYNFGTYGMVAFDMGKLEEPAPTPTPTPTPAPSNPQTGDNSPVVAMVVLLVLAAVGMAVMCIGKKRFVK